MITSVFLALPLLFVLAVLTSQQLALQDRLQIRTSAPHHASQQHLAYLDGTCTMEHAGSVLTFTIALAALLSPPSVLLDYILPTL